MNYMIDLKQQLKNAWEGGFFYNLRYGSFNEQQYFELKKAFDQDLIVILSVECNVKFIQHHLMELLVFDLVQRTSCYEQSY